MWLMPNLVTGLAEQEQAAIGLKSEEEVSRCQQVKKQGQRGSPPFRYPFDSLTCGCGENAASSGVLSFVFPGSVLSERAAVLFSRVNAHAQTDHPLLASR
jgi:hypothetical protein